MDSETANKQVRGDAQPADSGKSVQENKDRNTTSLPSPPSSVKGTEVDSGRNADGLPSGEVAASGSSDDAHEGADAADAVNDELPPDDGEQEGANSQDKNTKSREKRPAYDSSDEEFEVADYADLSDRLGEIRTDSLYPKLSEERAPLQQRIKRGAKLAVQQMEYVRLIEDRMKDMEKRLRSIENKGVEPEPPAPPETTKQPADFILEIKRMTFQEYRPSDPNTAKEPDYWSTPIQHKRRHEFPGQLPYHLIDVVVSGINQPEQLGNDQTTKLAAGPLDPAARGPTIPAQDLTINEVHSVQPERIRINSSLLLSALEKITRTRFASASIDTEFELQDQVILRPFKLFIEFEQEIRDEIDRLEKIHMRNGLESEQKAPETDMDKGQTGSNPPITDVLNMPQNPTPEPSNGLADDKSQNATSDASASGEKEEIPPLVLRECLQELLVLRELLDKDLKPTFDLRRQIKDGSVRTIAFHDLWHLFSIGSEFVSNDSNGQTQTCRILSVSGGRPFLCTRFDAEMDPLDSPDSASTGREAPKFEILSYLYGFDGKELGACQQRHIIKAYDGSKPITSLPCFPINYSKHSRGLKPRDFFVERGKRFVELTRKTEVVHKRYNGLTLAMDEIREEVDSEVIIDESMAMLKNNLIVDFGVSQDLRPDPRETLEFLDNRCSRKGCCQNTMIHYDYFVDETRTAKMLENKGLMRDSIEYDSELTDDDYLICPCWVYGYVLRSRRWVKLDVSLVEDITESGSGFDSLVLPEGHKDTLLALVKTHSKGKQLEAGLQADTRQMDLVRGKGKGLIILLHGEPGVGKSSTAESVAEFTRRPLFQVTCGDIGDSADEVERRLENHFQLAHKWGCVMLLDEADVFLEARSKTDLARNAIVSVFLRVLEYYSGILFLTTNRVGAFDQAFRSRIHMSLFYPRIEEDATIRIWEMNIDRAREIWGDKLSIDESDRKAILKFASKHYKELAESETTWNGRQIRNAFQTAIALAEWDAYQGQLKFKSPVPLKPRLESEHFERVAKASKHFDAYLKETQVGTMADLASNNRERRDDFRG